MNTEERDKLHQAHGLTVGEVRIIGMKQSGQIPGGLKQFTPNNLDALKDEHFIKDGLSKVTIDEHELMIYHIAQEVRSFHPASGAKMSKPTVQKYSIQDFNFMKENRGFEGYTVAILHDPTLDKEAEPADGSKVADNEGDRIDFTLPEWTVPKLKIFAIEKKIVVMQSDKKADIIKKLQDNGF